MNKPLRFIQEDQVRVCHKNTCIDAKGIFAVVLVVGFTFMLVCVGIAAIKASNLSA
jgi:hypothetical protein